LKVNLGKEANADDLPQETKDEVRLPFHQVFSPNVDDVASDGRG